MSTKTQPEAEILKKALLRILRIIFIERRKYLGFDIKNVSAALNKAGHRTSKEEIYNFENGISALSKDKLLVLAKFYKISLTDILNFVDDGIDKKVEKEIKVNNNNISNKYINELSNLVGFGFKKSK